MPGSERLWALRVGEDTARLSNVPLLARGYALGDIVRFTVDEDGDRWAQEPVEYSGNCTIRIAVAQEGHGAEQFQAVLDAFAPLGVSGEGDPQFGVVALNVPPDVDVAQIKRLVVEGEALGRWDYDEGCVTDEWRRA